MIKTTTNYFNAHLKQFEAYQTHYLESLSSADPLLLQAIQYVINTPGKKFRAMMVYACGELFEIPLNLLNPLALAIEFIHAYSLVHDDLPAMDNDDFRRGRPSCHKAFDEATAILTGNALHHLAFAHLLEALPSQHAITVSKLILDKIGIKGILSGQNLDLKSLNNSRIDLDSLKQIHYLKTTTLLEAIALSVASMKNANLSKQQALTQYCKHLGIAYQMLDDYGDYYATETWGKRQASDIKNNKFTFVQFYDKAALEQLIIAELKLAQDALLVFDNSEKLFDLCQQINARLNAIQQHE
ncbi:MAG: polyprenyl synthetase family protein [Gammaproteobacteria bacterium]|nr:polyprenyl synthetase family protein [Gammaproteobacteria bacterium]